MNLPAPLTPPECDLRGLPFMPMDVVRLLDSDLFALSSGEEFKAALALWCKAWLQVPAASLPDDDRVLAYLSGSGSRWKKLRGMSLRGWIKCSDGRLYHAVIAEKANEAWKHRLAQRERANKRWGNTETPSGGNATAHTGAYATASPTAMQGTAKPKPREEEEESLPLVPTPARAADCFNEVCEAASWSPRTDTQRVEALSIIDGWLASGFDFNLDILAGIRQAQASRPERTRNLKRFTSTIRGKHADRRGASLKGGKAGDLHRGQQAREIVAGLTQKLTANG